MRSRWVSPFLHSGPPTLSPAPCGPRVWAQRGPSKFSTETERDCTVRRSRENRGETQRGEEGGQDWERRRRKTREREEASFRSWALGGGAERGPRGRALGSQESWGRGGGRTLPAAGPPRPRGRAESWSRGPALPFLPVPDAEAASGEAAPRSHQPQPRRAEAAAAGTDPGPGQSFRTPKHPVLASQGCPLGWGQMLAALATPAPRRPHLSPALGIPSQTPSCSQIAIFVATSRVCKFHTLLCQSPSRVGLFPPPGL